MSSVDASIFGGGRQGRGAGRNSRGQTGPLVGKCMQMCPASELNQHDAGLCSPFEMDASGRFARHLAIKTFHRSDAGQIVSEDDVRPLPVLQQTVSHILNVVIGEMTGKSANTSEINMYLYVRDRFRAIRQDITYQRLQGPEVIDIYETMALFFIWSGLRFFRCKVGDFDPVQNREQITQTLLSLDEQYDATPGTRHEVLFRAMHLMVALSDEKFMSKVMALSNAFLQTKAMQQVLMLRQSIIAMDVPGYFQTLQEMPVQMAVFAVQNSTKLWATAGRAFRRGYGRRPFTESILTSFLRVPVEDLSSWNQAFKMVLENGMVRADIQDNSVNTGLLPSVLAVDQLVTCREMGNFLSFRNCPDDDIVPIPVEVPTPVPEAKPEEVIESVPIDEVVPQKPPQEETPPSPVNESEPEVENEPTPQEPVHFFREEPKIEPKVVVKVIPPPVPRRRNIECAPICEHEIFAMIPPNALMPSSATVLVIADDDSESAQFARRRFTSTDTTLFRRTFRKRGSDIHVLITCDKNLPGISAVLNCNETFQATTQNTIQFDIHSGYSEVLSFNDRLRRTVQASIRAIVPIDLGKLLGTCLSHTYDILSTSAWRWATANSVIIALNGVITCFGEKLEDATFRRFLVPFQHGLLDSDDFDRFVGSIKGLHLQMLPEIESAQPLEGTTWPYFIRNHATLELTRFIVPVTSDFSSREFISAVIADSSIESPRQCVQHDCRIQCSVKI